MPYKKKKVATLSKAGRISRNNKNRGTKFERDVADILKWQRVPYSGAVKEWGGADVVDGFFKKKGFWAAECKTQVVEADKVANLNIKKKWVGQMIGGEHRGRHGIIVLRRVRQHAKPGVPGPLPYVLMLEDVWTWFRGKIREGQASSLDYAWDRGPEEVTCFSTKTTGNGYNFSVKEDWLPYCSGGQPVAVDVWMDGDFASRWYVLTLEDFAHYVHTYRIMEYDDASD